MGNCDKKSTGNVNLRENARTFYILTANLRFFSGFSVNSRAIDRILRDLRYIPRKICSREMPHEFTENPQKNRKLTVNI